MIEGRPSGLQAALVGVSVRLPRVVLTLACALLVFGLFALARAKYDVFPEFAPPTVVIWALPSKARWIPLSATRLRR